MDAVPDSHPMSRARYKKNILHEMIMLKIVRSYSR